jgi:hypothetical protein
VPYSEPPYTPGYGMEPPLLAGRDELLGRTWEALKAGPRRPDFHQAWTGERGVGKTVAAQVIADRTAKELGWAVVRHQAVPGEGTLQALMSHLPEALGAWGRRGREFRQLEKEVTLRVNLGVVSVATTLRAGPEATPVTSAFEGLVRQVGAFASKNTTGLLLTLDEAQVMDQEASLSALSRALQTARVERLPVAVIFTGLPSLQERLSGAGTYIRRIQKYELGALSPDASRLALVEPAARHGVLFSPEALNVLVEQADGGPYYVQLFGYYAWKAAGAANEITAAHAKAGLQDAYAQLDWEFKPTWAKLSPLERRYVLVVAEVGMHDATTEQVARLLSRTTSQLSSTRDRLINVHQVLEAPALGVVRLRQGHFGQWACHRAPARLTPAPPLDG